MFAHRARRSTGGRSTSARSSISPDVLAARARPAPADGRVRAEPLPARVALPPRARRRVPGHEPRAVGARVAARASRGAKGSGWRRRPLPPSIFIVGDRKQSIYGSATPTSRVLRRGRRATSTALRPGGDAAPGDLAQLPRGAGAARVRQRRCSRRCREGAATRADAFRYDETRPVPGRPAAPRRARREPALGLVGRATTPAACAAAVAAEIARLLRDGDGARPRDRRAARRRGRATSRSCSDRATAIASSSARSRRAASRPTSTRGSASSTPTRSRTSSRCCGTWPIPASDLRAAAFLRSRFVRLSDRGARARSRPAWRPRSPAPDAAGRPLARSTTRTARVLAHAARGASRGWLALVDRVPPAELLDRVLAETRVRVRAARAAPAAGAREPEEDARRSCGASRTAATRRSARIAEHLDRAVGRRRVERRHRRASTPST